MPFPATQPWHSVLPGATLATVMWFFVTMLFGWYLQNYADYSVIYGSLGVAIALLVWMYMISLVILIGAEFNAMLFPRSTLRQRANRRGKLTAGCRRGLSYSSSTGRRFGQRRTTTRRNKPIYLVLTHYNNRTHLRPSMSENLSSAQPVTLRS